MAITFCNGHLSIISDSQSVPLSDLVKGAEDSFYVYDLDEIRRRLAYFETCFSHKLSVHYAMKANSHPLILKAVAQLGLGVDVVSAGEIRCAVDAGVLPKNMVFSGVGKKVSEIELAIKLGVKQINVESPSELRRIGKIAKLLGSPVNVAFRMNPDVDPDTHPYIKTGFRDNKFGMDQGFLPELETILKDHPLIQLVGLTLHIGSQIRDLSSIYDAIKKTLPTLSYLKDQGHQIQTFDIGGGVGISYEDPDGEKDFEFLKEFGSQVSALVEGWDFELLIEPGRIVVGRSGVLLTQIQYIKKSPYKNFAIVDAGMHQLMRPCLYGAYHRIVTLEEIDDSVEKEMYDVVGPICESSDVLGSDRLLPQLTEGQWLAICDAGAYGYSLANNYNAHGMPKEVVIGGGVVVNG